MLKEWDFTLLGVTGFTGKYCFRHVLGLLALARKQNKKFPRFAIAGRSKDRLEGE